MRNHTRALDVLLRRHQNGVPAVALFWLCFTLLLVSLQWVHQEAQAVFCVQFVLLGVLPLCASWDNRLLQRVREHRFLDMTLLTGLTAQDWSDTLVRRSAATLWSTGWKIMAAVIALSVWWSPGSWVQTGCWLLTVAALTVTLSYLWQLGATVRPNQFGRQVRLTLTCGPLAALAWAEVTDWATWQPRVELIMVACSMALLVLTRWIVVWRLQRALSANASTPPFMARAMRPWSHNLIVMRESWRSGRRGGLLAVACRRYLPFVLFTALVAKTVFDVGLGRGPWFIYYNAAGDELVGWLSLYAVVGVLLVYWSTLSAQQHERDQEATVLMWITPLRAVEYLNGWIDCATRYRYLEVASIYSVGLLGMAGCWWAALGWGRWIHVQTGMLATTLVDVVGMGLMTIVLVRAIACLALRESAVHSTWLAKQVSLFGWLVPYVATCAMLGGLSFGLGLGFGQFFATILAFATMVGITLLFYRAAYRSALVHISRVFCDYETLSEAATSSGRPPHLRLSSQINIFATGCS